MSLIVSFYGRLAFDPRQVQTRAGKDMSTARVAVDITGKDAAEPQTFWVDLLGFGPQAEALAQLKKGDAVSVIGRLTRSSYTAGNGEEREQYTVIADALVSARTPRPNPAPRAAGRVERREPAPALDDDIPF